MTNRNRGENSMAERSSLDVEWLLDRDASSDEVDAVTRIVIEEGFPGPVRAAVSQKGLSDEPWTIVALTTVALFLKGFFEEAGRTGYHDLRRLVSRLFGACGKGKGYVEISDRDSLTTIVFPPELPEEAFKQFVELGLENIKGKYWVWDPDQNGWIFQSIGDE